MEDSDARAGIFRPREVDRLFTAMSVWGEPCQAHPHEPQPSARQREHVRHSTSTAFVASRREPLPQRDRGRFVNNEFVHEAAADDRLEDLGTVRSV